LGRKAIEKKAGVRMHGCELRHALLDRNRTNSTPLCRLHTSMPCMHAAVLLYGAGV
jgi:hypothetical protein